MAAMVSSKPNNKQGKRRVKIARLEKGSDKYAAFSKRRHGIFKKASELCTYCNVELAIILLSPGMKPYSFGHPSAQTIINRFRGVDDDTDEYDVINKCIVRAQKDAEIQRLNEKLDGILNQIAAGKKVVESMKKKAKEEEAAGMMGYWWKRPVGEINDVEQLEALKDGLGKLKLFVLRQATKVDKSIVPHIVNYSMAMLAENNANASASRPGVLMFANYYSNLLNKPNTLLGNHPTATEVDGSTLFNPAASYFPRH